MSELHPDILGYLRGSGVEPVKGVELVNGQTKWTLTSLSNVNMTGLVRLLQRHYSQQVQVSLEPSKQHAGQDIVLRAVTTKPKSCCRRVLWWFFVINVLFLSLLLLANHYYHEERDWVLKYIETQMRWFDSIRWASVVKLPEQEPQD